MPRYLFVFGWTACLISVGATTNTLADAPPGSATASKVTNPVAESTLTQVKLRPDAQMRLGIQVQAPVRGTMQERRSYPALAMAPMGNDVTLNSPIVGIVRMAAEIGNLQSSWRPDRGAVLLTVVPTTPDGGMFATSDHIAYANARSGFQTAIAAAEGEAKSADVELEASRIRLKRAEVLRQSNASAQKTLDDATAEFQKADARAGSTKLILATLRSSFDKFEKGSPSGVPITAPFKGQVAELHVSDGQLVSAGTPLIRVTNTERMWIRVPVPVGEFAHLDDNGAALVGALGAKDANGSINAKRISGPRTANAVNSTVDLYFEFANTPAYIPGQRLSASLPTKRQSGGIVIPPSCIVIDMHGGAWVYQCIAELTYVRQRVDVVNSTDKNALLKGLPSDAPVVVTGAAELFGIEFGAGK